MVVAEAPALVKSLLHLWPKQNFAFNLIFGPDADVEQMLYGGAAGGAKDLDITTPIPTPSGWKAMGDLRTGDLVLDERGRPARITYAHPLLHDSELYRLTFDDGTNIDAGAEHLWLTYDAKELEALSRRTPEFRERRRAHRPSRATGSRGELVTAIMTERNHFHPPATLPALTGTVRRTDEIAATLRTASGRTNHAVPVAAPLDLPEQDLPLSPFLLGCWLGDGAAKSGQMCTMDAEIETAFIAGGYPPGKKAAAGQAWTFTALGMVGALREAGVLGNKHIPPAYLRASREQRLALLQGLMDTDGTVSESGSPSFTNTNRAIIDGVHELIVSLGWKVHIRESRAMLYGKDCGPVWYLKWKASEYVFRLSRKRSRQRLATRRTTRFRYIVSCERIPTVTTRCITVANPSGLFLAGRSMVPTHNSHFVRAVACYVANLWPGSDFAIFRRTDAELEADHIEKWLEDVDPYVPGGRFFSQAMEYHWPSPDWCWCPKGQPCAHSSKTLFRHVDADRAEKKHQGAEFAGQAIDEATHFKGYQIDYLYTRVRAPDSKRLPQTVAGPDGQDYQYPGWPGWRRIQLLTANPGDVGHLYMIDTYIDPVEGVNRGQVEGLKSVTNGPGALTDAEGNTVWYEEITNLRGEDIVIKVDLMGAQDWTVEVDLPPPWGAVHIKRAYVPARVLDNPALDPKEYAAGLAVGTEEQRRRLLDGDWSFFEGQAFSMLSPDLHLVTAEQVFGAGYFVAPKDWEREIGYDHGTTAPASAEWVCVDPDGFYVFYQEYHAVGLVPQHIEATKDRMARDGHMELRPIADPQMVRMDRGHQRLHSVMDEYAWNGPPPENATGEPPGLLLQHRYIERETGRMVLQRLFTPDPNRAFPPWHKYAGQMGSPGAFVATQCPNLWRELNGIRYKEGDTNDTVKEDDHGFDSAWRAIVILERRIKQAPRRQRTEVIAQSTPQRGARRGVQLIPGNSRR